jgi:hypothetical protein
MRRRPGCSCNFSIFWSGFTRKNLQLSLIPLNFVRPVTPKVAVPTFKIARSFFVGFQILISPVRGGGSFPRVMGSRANVPRGRRWRLRGPRRRGLRWLWRQHGGSPFNSLDCLVCRGSTTAIRRTVRFLRRHEHGRGQARSFGGVAETFDARNRGARVQAMDI